MLDGQIIPWLLSSMVALLLVVVLQAFVQTHKQPRTANGVADRDTLVKGLVAVAVGAMAVLLTYLCLAF